MSVHHQAIKNDPRWHAARAACLARDDFQCVRCMAGEQLEVDHVLPLRDYPELAFDLDNLQTLCETCHDEKEREYEAAKQVRISYVSPKYRELESLIQSSIL